MSRRSGHVEGWDFVDATFTAIELYGTACDVVKVDRDPAPGDQIPLSFVLMNMRLITVLLAAAAGCGGAAAFPNGGGNPAPPKRRRPSRSATRPP